MTLRVVGAGLPRTGTSSLSIALEHLLGGHCHNMSQIPGHPFDLGLGWDQALAGGTPDWDQVLEGYNAAVDWPASMFWQELSIANPEALVLLSKREDAETWYQSINATILPYARMALAPDWSAGCGLIALLERFTGTHLWDDPAILISSYDRHNARVLVEAPKHRLLQWHAAQGWQPICDALGVPVPDIPFPWVNKRSEWE